MRRIVLVTLALAVLVPGTGKASGPEFTSVSATGDCEPTHGAAGFPAIDCVPYADADQSGRFFTSAWVISGQGGLLPTRSVSYAIATFEIADEIASSVKSRTYTTTVHINRAEARNQTTADANLHWNYYWANMGGFSVDMTHSACDTCFGGGEAYVVDARDFWAPPSITDETFVWDWTLSNGNKPIPPGKVTVRMAIVSDASVGDPIPDRGQARVDIDGAITGISIA